MEQENNTTKRSGAVTIADIAKAAGVSKATVSLALNGSPVVKDETREKVTAAAASLGYVPNFSARRLVSGKSGMLGVVVPDIENVYYATLVKELTERVSEAGWSLSIFISSNDPDRESRAVRDMIASRVEGIIYVPVNTPGGNDAVPLILNSGIPAVCATTLTDKMSCVLCDLGDGMRRLTERLLATGPKSVIYLDGSPGVYTLDVRREAFSEAVRSYRESGHNIVTRTISIPSVDYFSAERAVAGLGELPDAIVSVNDFMALGVVNHLTSRGISVPDRVQVTGFDDCVFAVSSPVPLTTVRQDIGILAEKTVALLKRELSGETSDREVILIPTDVVTRRSTKK
ncbi:MAG: LacI family DNA-binding transcriptional regulator [Eubacteriales bacterium]